jgi:hypothetical protein
MINTNYTKDQIKELFLKIMVDLEIDYFNKENISIKLFENETQASARLQRVTIQLR